MHLFKSFPAGLALTALCLLGSATRPAAAQSRTVLVKADHTGWYDNTGFHNSANSNYIVGGPQTYGQFANNFFEFDLSSISRYTQITSATLQVIQGVSNSEYPSVPFLSYGLYDVSTAIPTLISSQVNQTSIYNDLGSGQSYGTFQIDTTYHYEDTLSFNLNQAALQDLNAHRGDTFAIGGALDLSQLQIASYGEEYTFAATNGAGDGKGFGATLSLATVPEASTTVSLGLLLTLGGLAMAVRKKRSTTSR